MRYDNICITERERERDKGGGFQCFFVWILSWARVNSGLITLPHPATTLVTSHLSWKTDFTKSDELHRCSHNLILPESWRSNPLVHPLTQTTRKSPSMSCSSSSKTTNRTHTQWYKSDLFHSIHVPLRQPLLISSSISHTNDTRLKAYFSTFHSF